METVVWKRKRKREKGIYKGGNVVREEGVKEKIITSVFVVDCVLT